jgi:hypothetical protein
MMIGNLTRADFRPGIWAVDEEGEKYSNGNPKWIIDEKTEKKYLNEHETAIRTKLFLLSTLGCVGTSLCTGTMLAGRIARIAFCENFLRPGIGCKEGIKKTGVELAKIVATPFIFLGMQAVACYGFCFSPQDGRKYFASLQEIQFDGQHHAAPCFAPAAKRHLLGNDIEMQNAW